MLEKLLTPEDGEEYEDQIKVWIQDPLTCRVARDLWHWEENILSTSGRWRWRLVLRSHIVLWLEGRGIKHQMFSKRTLNVPSRTVFLNFKKREHAILWKLTQ
jgi:hypothetical protein